METRAIKAVPEAVLLLDYVKSSGFTATFGDVAVNERKEALGRLVNAAATHCGYSCQPGFIGDAFFITFANMPSKRSIALSASFSGSPISIVT